MLLVDLVFVYLPKRLKQDIINPRCSHEVAQQLLPGGEPRP
jgi:hypothetical protein